MRQFTFSEAELEKIGHDRYHHPNPTIQRRMEILWLKHHGHTHQQIAKLAGVSRSSVQRCLSAFLQGGLDAVRLLDYHKPTSQLDLYRTPLEEYFTKNPPRSIKEAQDVIEKQTGIRRSETQVRRFLDRLGMKPRKVSAIPLPPNTTPEEHAKTQRDFLDNTLEPKLEEARQGKRDVYFVDAAHFVHAVFLGILWCFVRLHIPAASGRKRFNVLGAVNATTHEFVLVSNHTYINADSVCELLRKLAEKKRPEVPLTVVLDNARYQKCAKVKELARELGIELEYLTTYSPNLNLIERVWRFVKSQTLRSKYYAKYEDFHTAIQNCLNQLSTTYKQSMKSLLTHNFQTFDHVSILAA